MAFPGLINNLRWNTTGITVLTASPPLAASGLYMDDNDTLYVTDEKNNYVVWKLLKDAINATVIAGLKGLNGSNSSQLNYPNDVCVDKEGNLYVSDTNNHRIQKFVNGSMNGITIAGISGVSGSALNQFNYPRCMAFDATETYVYVADTGNHRVMRYLTNSTSGMNGTLVAGGNGPNITGISLNLPWGIQYLPAVSNALFITNSGGHSVMRWIPGAASGVFIGGLSGFAGSVLTLLRQPMGIKVDTHLNMYVVDSGNHRVQILCNNNRTGRTIIGITGNASNSTTQLNLPRGIAFDSAMNMYISDTGNNRIQKFLKL